MKSFAAACLLSLACAETIVSSGITANDSDAALDAMFLSMPGNVSGAVLGDGLDETANAAAVSLNDWFIAEAKPLPKVCDAGRECRLQVTKTTTETVEEQWKNTLTDIETIFQKSFTRSQAILETAYDEAKQCEPGCICSQISVEYADIIRQQKVITEEVMVLTTKETELHTSQAGYLVSCPEYEYIHLTGDEVVAVYDIGSFSTEEVVSTNVEESNEVINSDVNQSYDEFTMTGTEEVGVETTTENNIVGSGDSDWEHVGSETTVTQEIIGDDGFIPEAGYQ
jgi:hypothetical protein